MQAIYAYSLSDGEAGYAFEHNLKEFSEDVASEEKKSGNQGDAAMIVSLFHKTIERSNEFDEQIQARAENWELDRIALMDRILMKMALAEMLEFTEVPVKVTINEYLEIAKQYSTPKSSKFINGILDGLYADLKKSGKIKKTGRGLIDSSIPKKRNHSNKDKS